MSTAVMLFTRDLRVDDNPALHAACGGAVRVVPLFVFDPKLRTTPGRQRFLIESLEDLRTSLRMRGGDLVVRRGDPVRETIAVARAAGASSIMLAADVSAYAMRRQRRLAEAAAAHRIRVELHDGVTVVPPGALRPGTGGHQYRVFTPYWRAWRNYPRRAELPAPGLTSRLRIDWRQGAEWYARSLLDADVANNNGNWQWVAGTGTDTKSYRRFSPLRQALRFDPHGAYVRRWVPELADIPGRAVHEPWLLPANLQRPLRYDRPLADAVEAPR